MSTQQRGHEFTIRRKILTLFGAKFHVYNQSGELVGFSKQKAFRLKEDIRFFSDETMAKPLVTIRARSMIDFSAAYDVTNEVTGQSIGVLRRKGMASFVRDEWQVLDPSENQIALLREDSTSLALVRRLVPMGNLVPQHFVLSNDDTVYADYRTHFNPFVHRMTVKVESGCPVDLNLVLAGGILLVAVEGRQSN